MKKCKYHKFYKALRPPQCGCDACEEKWLAAIKEKNKKALAVEDCPNPSECEGGCVGYCTEVDEVVEDVFSFIERNS